MTHSDSSGPNGDPPSDPVPKPRNSIPPSEKLDWEFSYVREEDVFPEAISGRPWLPRSAWKDWEEPYRTTYADYVTLQNEKERAVRAVRDAVGRRKDIDALTPPWRAALKMHSAILTLAEFAAVPGNLRAARFGRDSAWRTTAVYGALDETRHTQIPLLLMHELVRSDPQFDWTHRLYHTDNWIAVAARHFFDEVLTAADPIEFALAANFVFETGFTNLQFTGLGALADKVGDRMFETMQNSIQTDEARHAQIGPAVLEVVCRHDSEYAQQVLDRVFWRSWLLISILTGFSMDYLSPVKNRPCSFREFMEEWVLEQYLNSLESFGLRKPWYWDIFLDSLDYYHHMVYASAYTHRATVWFDMVLPGPKERAWLRRKYPRSWDSFEPVWDQVSERAAAGDPGVEWNTHGATPLAFCDLCQIILCGGTPGHNTACSLDYANRRYLFCSEPCKWIFSRDPGRYAAHKSVSGRILFGEAPSNLVALVRETFSLGQEEWGKDAYGGNYPWLRRPPRKYGRAGQGEA